MKVNKVLAAASGLVLASFLAGQLPHNPVPTRIETEIYGGYTTTAGLEIDCYLGGAKHSVIRVRGGDAGSFAQILVAPRPSWIRLPFENTLLVSPDAVPYSGVFDAEGAFCMSLDLAEEGFCGYSVYFQGLQVKPSHDGCELTAGLKVTYHEGNRQPDLNYEGPPVTAILCKASENRSSPEFGVLFRADLPEPGYDLVAERVEMSDRGTTLVFLSLVPKAALPEMMKPPIDGERLRNFVEFGELVAPDIEVLVSLKAVADYAKDYARAAWIHTVLPPSSLQEFIDGAFVDGRESDVGDREATDFAGVAAGEVSNRLPEAINR